MPEIVAANDLVKRYGPRVAVRGVSFSIDEGEIIGLLGPNGSGKSTILRMLTGFLPPSAGSARVAGLDVTTDSLAVRMRVGYVPEDAPLYDGMRVSEFLHFMAAIKGLGGVAARGAVAAATERLDLTPVLRLPIGKLSRGYRQRVAIAQALLNDPPVLIFDEPTNALDAYQVIGVRELIRSMRGRRAVIVASHVLTEIERIADRIMVLRDGRLLTADAMRAADVHRRFRLRVAGSAPPILAALQSIPGVLEAAPADTPENYLVELAPGPLLPAELARAIVGRGFALCELAEIKTDLEQVFLELTRQAGASEALAA